MLPLEASPRRAGHAQLAKPLCTENHRVQQRQLQEANMSIFAWIILGLVAGFISSKIVSGTDRAIVMDIILAIVGAVVGASLFNTFGMAGVLGFNLYSLLVAVVGASLLVVVFHAAYRRPAPKRHGERRWQPEL
jgi:uncharacterized membrane protein YeaQ/YmgE (transglycosylase-associated protein family)